MKYSDQDSWDLGTLGWMSDKPPETWSDQKDYSYRAVTVDAHKVSLSVNYAIDGTCWTWAATTPGLLRSGCCVDRREAKREADQYVEDLKSGATPSPWAGNAEREAMLLRLNKRRYPGLY